jgi:hypothetical protein
LGAAASGPGALRPEGTSCWRDSKGSGYA